MANRLEDLKSRYKGKLYKELCGNRRKVGCEIKTVEDIMESGVIRGIKQFSRHMKKFYVGVILSERHVKFLAFEMARTNSSASSILRFIIDDFIDRKSREDSRFGRAMDVLTSNINNGGLKEFVENFGDKDKGEFEVIKKFSGEGEIEGELGELMVDNDFGDEYIMSVPGSGDERIKEDNGE